MPRGKATAPAAEETSTDATHEELVAQIEQLKADIAAITRTIGDLGSQTIRDGKQRAQAAYNDAYAQSESIIGDAVDSVCDIEQQITTAVRERPLTSLLAAAGLGYLFALIFRR